MLDEGNYTLLLFLVVKLWTFIIDPEVSEVHCQNVIKHIFEGVNFEVRRGGQLDQAINGSGCRRINLSTILYNVEWY